MIDLLLPAGVVVVEAFEDVADEAIFPGEEVYYSERCGEPAPKFAPAVVAPARPSSGSGKTPSLSAQVQAASPDGRTV